MKLSPRTQLLLLMGLFALPIAASLFAYNFLDIRPTANYGELLSPPPHVPEQQFEGGAGGTFSFAQLAGRWAMATSDSGACEAACREKLATMRQLRLALGRNAGRVERVLVVDDARPADPAIGEAFPGMHMAITPRAVAMPPGLARDRAHIYLVDPNGNVVMRWPWRGEMRRMLKDMERVLKASQIG